MNSEVICNNMFGIGKLIKLNTTWSCYVRKGKKLRMHSVLFAENSISLILEIKKTKDEHIIKVYNNVLSGVYYMYIAKFAIKNMNYKKYFSEYKIEHDD